MFVVQLAPTGRVNVGGATPQTYIFDNLGARRRRLSGVSHRALSYYNGYEPH